MRRTSGRIWLAAALVAWVGGCKRGNEPARARAVASAIASASTSASAPAAAPPAPVIREGSSIARAPDDSALFVADEDHRAVRVFPLPIPVRATPTAFPVPGRPAQLVMAGDRVLVTVRDTGQGDGALLVLSRKGLELAEVARVALSGDAWGIAVSGDGATALVTSAWTHTLSAVDLNAAKVRWSVDVAREPRGVVILPGQDRAYVTHLTGGAITRVDSLAAARPSVKRVELPAGPLYSPVGAKLGASLGYAAVASPAGDRVFFPRHALGALGPDAWFGVGVVDVLVTADDRPLAPARSIPIARFVEPWAPGPVQVIAPSAPIAEPHAVAYRSRSRTLLVASEGTDTLFELDARALDPTLAVVDRIAIGSDPNPVLQVNERGAAPAGIALSADETVAYIHCRGSHEVVTAALRDEDGRHQATTHEWKLAEDDPKAIAYGRRLFYAAGNGDMSGGLACEGCHPEGRDDGQVWREVTVVDGSETFTNFFAGADHSAIDARWGPMKFEGKGGFGYARQTPMLAGRLSATGPYGWHGESVDLAARIAAGFDLHRWRTRRKNDKVTNLLAGALVAYLRHELRTPPRRPHELDDEERRGKAIFDGPDAACSGCHAPQTQYTDRAPVPLKRLAPLPGFAEEENAVFRTPSLAFVAGTPPYLHDGRFDTLESLVEHNQDRMGKTDQLSAEDKKALVAFLKTL